MTTTLSKPKRNLFAFTQTNGIYVLPVILSPAQISEIYKTSQIKASHHDDNGHGEGGHRKLKFGEVTQFKADKPYNFPWLAELIFDNVPTIKIQGGYTSAAVDANVQIYTLPDGGGEVPVHVDKNFQVDGMDALYSILIYLNDGYTGGETIFFRNMYGPKVPVGAGVLFRHNILHEGLKVTSGEKHVLKTDLLFSSI